MTLFTFRVTPSLSQATGSPLDSLQEVRASTVEQAAVKYRECICRSIDWHFNTRMLFVHDGDRWYEVRVERRVTVSYDVLSCDAWDEDE